MLSCKSVLAAALFGLTLLGCEAVIGDFEAGGCPVDPPTNCADIGEEMAQVGCCSGDGTVVYFCTADGRLGSTSCEAQDLTFDYDPDQEIMTCVE